MLKHYVVLVIAGIVMVHAAAISQQSGMIYRRAAVVGANHVSTVFGNWGVIGQPCDFGPRGAWMRPTNGYIGDESFMLGIELPIKDYTGDGIPDTVHSVITCPVFRPAVSYDVSPDGKQWTVEPVDGYFAPFPNQSVALSNDYATWPSFWPDHPEWGSGAWNGLFGKNSFVGDQETFYVVDDNNDERFNFPQNNPRGIAFKPDTTNISRNGAGIRFGVRYIQLDRQFFKDVLIKVYDIANESKYNYQKVVFGGLMGTYVGVTGCVDNGEWDDDASVYFASNDFIMTWDFSENNSRNPSWQGPVGRYGVAFLQAPNHNRTASYRYSTPAGEIPLGSDSTLWQWLQPGNYSHPSSIVHDTIALNGEDGDYTYGSDYFSLATGETKRIATVLSYGSTKNQVLQNILLAKALWYSDLNIDSVEGEIALTDFSSYRIIAGTQPIQWTSKRSNGSVDLWFSSDAGDSWQVIETNVPNTGSYSWNSARVGDCPFGKLRVFIKDTSGNVYGFWQSPSYVTIRNTTTGMPFIKILGDGLNGDSTILERTRDFSLLIGSSQPDSLTVKVYYKTGRAEAFVLTDTFDTRSDTTPQMRTVNIGELPNSNHFQLKFEVSDGVSLWNDSTDEFRKQTPREIVQQTNLQHVSGWAEVPVEIHIVDPLVVKQDTYDITFDDTTSAPKTFSVYDRSISSYVLRNVAFHPRVESKMFDGLALYTEDTITSVKSIAWSRNVSFNRAVSVSVVDFPGMNPPLIGYRMPNDYRIVFHDVIVDTSVVLFDGDVPKPVKFQVFSIQSNRKVKFGAYNFGPGVEEIFLLDQIGTRDNLTWDVLLSITPPDSLLHDGDTLFVRTKKGLSVLDLFRVSGVVVDVRDEGKRHDKFFLSQNYPNPFNPSTDIRFQIKDYSRVNLKVYDMLGQEVAILVNEAKQPGEYAVHWNASDQPSGVYFYRLTAGVFNDTKKLVLIK